MADNFFLALLPPPNRVQALCELRDQSDHGKPLDDARFHITMYLLDPRIAEMDNIIARLRGILENIRLPACSVLFDEIIGGEGTMLLRGNETPPSIDMLRDRIVSLLMPAGIAQYPGYQFRPHVSLRRGKVERGRWSIDPIGWPATEIVFVRSYVGKGRHEIIDRWELKRN